MNQNEQYYATLREGKASIIYINYKRSYHHSTRGGWIKVALTVQPRRMKSHFTCTLDGIFPRLFSQTSVSRHPWAYKLQSNCTFTFIFLSTWNSWSLPSPYIKRLVLYKNVFCADKVVARVPLPLKYHFFRCTPWENSCSRITENKWKLCFYFYSLFSIILSGFNFILKTIGNFVLFWV
jgi:hypothetical protein